eukprot:5693859-Amphidinium_carterae.1
MGVAQEGSEQPEQGSGTFKDACPSTAPRALHHKAKLLNSFNAAPCERRVVGKQHVTRRQTSQRAVFIFCGLEVMKISLKMWQGGPEARELLGSGTFCEAKLLQSYKSDRPLNAIAIRPGLRYEQVQAQLLAFSDP